MVVVVVLNMVRVIILRLMTRMTVVSMRMRLLRVRVTMMPRITTVMVRRRWMRAARKTWRVMWNVRTSERRTDSV